MKIQNVETMQSYFTRVSQIKEKIEAVSEEYRSGDGHLEWPPRIMGFIHVRNVCQIEVITFSTLWEEEEALPIRRENKMGAIEDQDFTIQRRYLKR